jgi:hypothetical protein
MKKWILSKIRVILILVGISLTLLSIYALIGPIRIDSREGLKNKEQEGYRRLIQKMKESVPKN